jgi:hypothetical protein
MRLRNDTTSVWILRDRRGPRRVERFASGAAALAALERMPEATLIVAGERLADVPWQGFLAQAARVRPSAMRVLARGGHAGAGAPPPAGGAAMPWPFADADAGADSVIDAPVTPARLEALAAAAQHTRTLRDRLDEARLALHDANQRLAVAGQERLALVDMLAGTVEATAEALDKLFTDPRPGAGDYPGRLLRVWRRWLSVIELADGRRRSEPAAVPLAALVARAATAAQVAVTWRPGQADAAHGDAAPANARAAPAGARGGGVVVVDALLAERALALVLAACAELAPDGPPQARLGDDAVHLLLAAPDATRGEVEQALAGSHPARPPRLWTLELHVAARLGEHAGASVAVHAPHPPAIELVVRMR